MAATDDAGSLLTEQLIHKHEVRSMAVQMMMSSTQDFLSLNTSSDFCSAQSRPADAESFDRALVAVADEKTPVETKDDPKVVTENKKPTPQKHTNLDKIVKKEADAVDAEIETIDTADAEIEPVADALPAILAEENDLKAILAQNGADVQETKIDDLIADAPELKQPRFDPDAILSALAPKSDEPIAETKIDPQLPTTNADATVQTAVIPPDEIPEMPTVDDLADNIDVLKDVTVVGKDDTSEEVVIKDADAIEAKTTIPEVSGDRIEQTDAKQPEMQKDTATQSTEQIKQTDDAHKADKATSITVPDEETAQSADGEASASTAEPSKTQTNERPSQADARSVDERIGELIARLRDERKGQDDTRGARDDRDFSSNARQKTQRSTQSSQTRKPISADTTPRADTRPDSHTREVAFGETLASKLRDAAERTFTPEAQPASRAGMTYAMDRANAFGDGIFTALEFMKTDGVQEARIVVEPPALGHIDVSIRASESGLQAAFKVDNEHLKQMVQQHIDILKSSLQTQGIHVSSIAVDIRNKEDQNGQGAAYAKNKKAKGGRGSDDETENENETTLVRLDLEKGLLHWIG